MPAQAIHYFMLSPYSVVMDVKMLDFFRHMGTATLISVTVLLIASLFIRHAWCRYLCPYGALMGVVSLLSPFRFVAMPKVVSTVANAQKIAHHGSRSIN
ncbi:putative electron transport protein [Escherichia coli]|nr:putative electron transport protein [Escherichia coli]